MSMIPDPVAQIARAILYEGYLLYPYTRSTTKNRQRWTFGGIYPPSFVKDAESFGSADRSEQQTECLVRGAPDARITVQVRFLHLIQHDEWEEAMEREVTQRDLQFGFLASGETVRSHFVFEGVDSGEGPRRGLQRPLHGAIEISAQEIEDQVYRLRILVRNTSEISTNARSEALLHSPISTHSILSLQGAAKFVSLLDPPPEFKTQAQECRNIGVWPVLVGEPGARDRMLSSPIILYDYPRVAPESPGDLYDGAEIDELLSLSILTLSDDEKARIRREGETGRKLLERTENLNPEDLLRLHGRLREVTPLSPGTRVRIRPTTSREIFDVALRGMTAVIESMEQDLDGTIHFAVTIEDDPGRDLGRAGQVGHRFYFKASELEPL